MEMAGLLLGLLGPVQQAKQLVDGFKRKRRAYHGNAALLEQVIAQYEHVINVHHQFHSNLKLFESSTPDPDVSNILSTCVNDIKRYEAELQELSVLRVTNRKQHKLKRFAKAEKLAEHIEEKKVIARVADNNSRHIGTQLSILAGQARSERQLGLIEQQLQLLRDSVIVGVNRRLVRAAFKAWWTVPAWHRVKSCTLSMTNCARCGGRKRFHPFDVSRIAQDVVRIRFALLQRGHRRRVVRWHNNNADEVELYMQVKRRDSNVCDSCITEIYHHRCLEGAALTGGVHYVQLGVGCTFENVREQLAGIVELTGGLEEACTIRASKSMYKSVALTMVWFDGRHTDFRILTDGKWEQNCKEAHEILQHLHRLSECSTHSTVIQRFFLARGHKYRPFRSGTCGNRQFDDENMGKKS